METPKRDLRKVLEEDGSHAEWPCGSDLRVSLVPPPGWRWVPDDEWRQELEDWDVDLEARTGISKEAFGAPAIRVVNTPPGYVPESPSVQVTVVPDTDDEWAGTEMSVLLHLAFVRLAFDDVEVPWGPEPVVFRGHPGHKAVVRLAQPRRDKPTLHFEMHLVHVRVGGYLVQIALGAPAHGVPEGLWEELRSIYESIRIEVAVP